MMKKGFVILLVLGLACAEFCAEEPSEADDEWIPVPLEEIERATLHHWSSRTQPATPETLPEEQAEPTGKSPTSAPSEDESAGPDSEAPPPPPRLSPEEIARRLRSKGASPVVLPRGVKARSAAVAAATSGGESDGGPSASEGQAVAGRIGRVKKIPRPGTEAEAFVVTFENNRRLPYESPRRLLPCRLLEEVETYLEAHPDVRFRFSGETTRDTKYSYLLLQRVAIVEEDVTDVEPPPVAKSPARKATTQPAGEDTTTGLIAEMLQDRPGRAIRTTPAPRRKADENVNSVAPAGETPFTPGKRELVVDRIIRVIQEPEGKWWQARFESDNTLREPPLRILPGLRLEWIKMMMADSGKSDMLLRVSGDVTYYRGKRYLMLRKVLRQRNMDEF
ncbi:MAG: hypothetical protein JW849_09410 [Phycisphaerae bacterium]|nr:hypothetical protein [Phycisphaerae bacterium]